MSKSPELKKEGLNLSKLAVPLGLLSLAVISLGAYSEKQKTALKERDKTCQFPGEHDCGGDLIIHQIIPPKYAERFEIDPDYAENGLVICRNSHKLIYPDVNVPKEEIPTAMKVRGIKLNQRRPYWNTIFDRAMNATAIRNTQKAKEDGWEFPEKRKRKKKS